MNESCELALPYIPFVEAGVLPSTRNIGVASFVLVNLPALFRAIPSNAGAPIPFDRIEFRNSGVVDGERDSGASETHWMWIFFSLVK